MANKETGADGFGDPTEAVGMDVDLAPGLLGEIRSVDPAAVQKRISDRMGKADSLDELFSATKGNTSDEMDGKAIRVLSVNWQPYEAADRGTIPLAVVAYVDLATNKEDEFATTASGLVNFLYFAGKLNAIPFEARIVGKRTRQGQTALNFEKV